MFTSHAFGVPSKGQTRIVPLEIQRKNPSEDELLIDIQYCGICHSDVEILSNHWGATKYPCVPGHEAIGIVSGCGPQAKQFRVGDVVGVGCMMDSCQKCSSCIEGWENLCEGPNGPTMTYSGYLLPKGKEAQAYNTFGAWADTVVVKKHFVVPIPPGLDLAKVAPLMCPGTATFGPLKRMDINPSSRIGIVGLGGPGHLAVQFAKAMGADNVTVFTTHIQKRGAGLALGADDVVLSTDEASMQKLSRTFDHILSTIPVPFDPAPYLALLKRRGCLTVMGLLGPYQNVLNNLSLASAGLSLKGSMIGSVAETRECLAFCVEKGIVPMVEVVTVDEITDSIERLKVADVRFRFVIDMRKR